MAYGLQAQCFIRLKARKKAGGSERWGKGGHVKTRVCAIHTEAAGTLKVRINNPI